MVVQEEIDPVDPGIVFARSNNVGDSGKALGTVAVGKVEKTSAGSLRLSPAIGSRPHNNSNPRDRPPDKVTSIPTPVVSLPVLPL